MKKKETINEVAENNEREELQNELTILNSSLTDSDSVRKMTTLDLNDEKDADLLLNSMQEVDFKLNDCIGKEIEVIGCYIVERDSEFYDDETGEAKPVKNYVTMLFDKDNKSYVTGSNACYMSFSDIVTIKGLPTREHSLTLIPVKVDAQEKGHSYLKLKLKINK